MRTPHQHIQEGTTPFSISGPHSLLKYVMPLIRRCGTHISESKLASVEHAYQSLRLGSEASVDYTPTIYAELHVHVVYENVTLEGGYIPSVHLAHKATLPSDQRTLRQ
jgi:hypothetical protein